MSLKSTMEIRKCEGCGITLQYSDDSKVGFIPKNKFKEGAIYCQRCFKLKNYNEKVYNDSLIVDEGLIDKVNATNNYAFFLIDFLNINDESINTFKQIKLNKTLVISKCDLIFKDINLERVKDNLRKSYDIKDNIIFLSSKKNQNINQIFTTLDKNNLKTTFILGYTNAGKSTLINCLKGNKERIIASSMPNTTLDFIEIKIGDYKIIDTPGFSLKTTFNKKQEFELIKKLNPVYFVSPINYQIKEEQIFSIEDRLYLKNFGNNSATFYISNMIKIKKIYKDEIDNYKEINVNEDNDVVIASLGFIHVKKKCTIRVNEEYYNLISVRDSILKK